MWTAYEVWQAGQHNKAFTVDSLIELYFASPQYTKELKPQTQRDYLRYSKKIKAVFGGANPDSITSPVIQLFMDTRGSKYPTAANRERTFLGIILRWGKARGLVTIPDPTAAVRPLKERQAGRYVEDSEYLSFYDWLGEKGHKAHQAAMEIAYLCGARQQDVLALTRQDVQEDGLVIYQQKTGKKQIKLWTGRLRDAKNLAQSINTNNTVQSAYLIRSKTGRPYTRGGFNAIWQREQKAALAAGVIKARFRFHDLKIKAVSDFEGGDKRVFSGHKTNSMMERYNRTPDRVLSLDKARIKKKEKAPKDPK
ncbi:tyrosine-type recombinase/integrase [Microbulbifer sp. TYP-18]|uniref:tyrosine-type recombinase/integrase n=1 Tax=Microbulbifer sp. TYP-18 TaxID=3230024 RepID=UPI0034C6C4B4